MDSILTSDSADLTTNLFLLLRNSKIVCSRVNRSSKETPTSNANMCVRRCMHVYEFEGTGAHTLVPLYTLISKCLPLADFQLHPKAASVRSCCTAFASFGWHVHSVMQTMWNGQDDNRQNNGKLNGDVTPAESITCQTRNETCKGSC